MYALTLTTNTYTVGHFCLETIYFLLGEFMRMELTWARIACTMNSCAVFARFGLQFCNQVWMLDQLTKLTLIHFKPVTSRLVIRGAVAVLLIWGVPKTINNFDWWKGSGKGLALFCRILMLALKVSVKKIEVISKCDISTHLFVLLSDFGRLTVFVVSWCDIFCSTLPYHPHCSYNGWFWIFIGRYGIIHTIIFEGIRRLDFETIVLFFVRRLLAILV